MELGDHDGAEDDLPDFSAPLPPDDRLWRHPSELGNLPPTLRGIDRRPGSRNGAWSVALVSGLIGSVLTFGLVASTGIFRKDGPVREVVVREQVALPARAAETEVRGVVGIAEAVRPAIVRIDVGGDTSGSGSGVLFRDNGYVLTNAHVVNEARELTVVLADGRELEGTVVGTDPGIDIAVVEIEADDAFPTAVLGTAEDLRVGQPAIAIGSPLGLLGGSSVTTGVVSALGRRVDSVDGPPLLDMIQTDAAIAPGSSGGALLDERGSVIGITTAIAVSDVGAEGLGFATPIDIARSVADEIIANGRAVHVWLGIKGSDLDRRAAEAAGVEGGALVEQVVTGSPAHLGELLEGDVIVAIDGVDVASMAALVVNLRERRPDDEVELTYLRGGRESTVTVRLVERPPDQEE